MLDMYFLNVKCPFTLTHDWLTCAVFRDTVYVHLQGADHEVYVVEGDVASSGVELFIVEFFASSEGEAIGASDGDVTGGVLVEERIVEEMATFGDG